MLLTSKHIFLREWVHTAKGVNTKTGCMSYFCVFNLFPYDSNASIMKPKAYHCRDLFFATAIWAKVRYFENERVHIRNFIRGVNTNIRSKVVQCSISISINEITLKKANEEHMVHQTRCAFLIFTYTATRSLCLSIKDYE